MPAAAALRATVANATLLQPAARAYAARTALVEPFAAAEPAWRCGEPLAQFDAACARHSISPCA